jgi:glycine cleavage system transcriptional repressor
MRRFAVAVVGPDRTGIVAGVSGALLRLGCNLEDISTTVLSGHFTMMVIVEAPLSVAATDIEGEFADLRRMGLVFSVWGIASLAGTQEASHALTVYGPDTTGIVEVVSTALAKSGVNITDMVCRLQGGQPSVYLLTIEIAIPPRVDVSDVREQIAAACAPKSLESSLVDIERSEL